MQNGWKSRKKKNFIINILCKMAETPEKYSIMNNSDVKCKTPKKKTFYHKHYYFV